MAPRVAYKRGEETRARILEAVRSRPGEPFSVRELATTLKIAPNTVSYHIRQLVQQGKLTRQPLKHRSIRIATPPRRGEVSS